VGLIRSCPSRKCAAFRDHILEQRSQLVKFLGAEMTQYGSRETTHMLIQAPKDLVSLPSDPHFDDPPIPSTAAARYQAARPRRSTRRVMSGLRAEYGPCPRLPLPDPANPREPPGRHDTGDVVAGGIGRVESNLPADEEGHHLRLKLPCVTRRGPVRVSSPCPVAGPPTPAVVFFVMQLKTRAVEIAGLTVTCRARLGGLLKFYFREAA